ncbi:hypothetical protein Sta7437_0881 [Stanieria cyanosphaera PCC 7437]|uniref:Uncharacterized protein n=1 Tax=Stanieria cyanosphaera (strain ATCC 29371 / PCC 7437) TaxID=111780 RepID=K9XQX6_STAC7|nr:hypothetical protein [Stanieria cyanosphaera]AFZ34466.1 hypothetical protein Sta7437_0881 [Stanieria cyanosphaera PCC 7437]
MLQIFYFGSIWFLVLSVLSWRLIKITQTAFSYLKRLHQIPCSKCPFFTGDYRLKCTVHPITAMSEEAINCRDFMAKSCSQPDHSTVFSKNCSNKKREQKMCAVSPCQTIHS